MGSTSLGSNPISTVYDLCDFEQSINGCALFSSGINMKAKAVFLS